MAKHKKYTDGEKQFMREYWYLGASILAEILGRDKNTIKQYMYLHDMVKGKVTKAMLGNFILQLMNKVNKLEAELKEVTSERSNAQEDVYGKEALS